MKTAAELRQLVIRIDHRSYPAYKDTKGMYQFPGYLLSIDHVQGDPFASPSRVSIQDFRSSYIRQNGRKQHWRMR